MIGESSGEGGGGGWDASAKWDATQASKAEEKVKRTLQLPRTWSCVEGRKDGGQKKRKVIAKRKGKKGRIRSIFSLTVISLTVYMAVF